MTLAGASISAVKWDYAGTATRAVSSLAVTVVLARILGPEPFGLIAIAWLVIGLGNLVADLGMGPALVQRGTISDSEIRYAFTIQVATGVGLMAILAVSAPVIAGVFNQPAVIPVIRALSAVFVLQALGVTAVSLLERQMNFKTIQAARISSYVIGFLMLGIPLALFGFGVWSLIVAQLSQAGLFSTISYLQVRHEIKPLLSPPSNSLLGFGVKVLLLNIVNWTISNIDSLFVGRFFDVLTLGLYNRAMVLVMTPMHNIVITLQHVMFSTYSRAQHDLNTVRKVYLASVGFMSMVMFPLYGCVALVPGTIIHGLFGRDWNSATPLLVPLALAMPFHAVMAAAGPLLWATNRVEREFRAQFLTLFILVIILLVVARISVTAMVWGVLAVSISRFFLVTHASLKTVTADWRSVLKAMRGGMLLIIPTGATVLFCDRLVPSLHDSVFLRLVLDAFVGAATLLTIVCLSPRLVFSGEMCWLFERIASHVPSSVRTLMRKMVPLGTSAPATG
jgi:O-antigen/teichoic acid export membrane protein